MSLLTVCRQTAARQSLSRTATLALRYNSNSNSNSSDIPKKLEHASSAITPAPVTKDVLVADVISGAPSELRHRSVRIFQPTRNTMQSGSAKGTKWRIDFDILQGAGRWENPLMGWASSADYIQGLRMSFRSKEDAIHFAEKQGWDYYVQQPTVKRIPNKNYSENYLYRPDTLRIMKTK
ncbi:NADH-ubiquinone oxidoreductase 21kDa subunit [Pterulicium gracile]|uniref:NADH dehydrogenase [ubiquinone] iron-sulfur protein 4, mitochondrial n=1 Tax=Pterulicium gracile TaxID=1884261 RepID=A0A5C3QII4_9AGAR|nr:NADH-ubiquinone oxidoreductase 21kDa subunit [Pterula gracilis]